MVEEIKEKEQRIFHGMWKWNFRLKIQILVFILKSFIGTQPCTFVYVLSTATFAYNGKVE